MILKKPQEGRNYKNDSPFKLSQVVKDLISKNLTEKFNPQLGTLFQHPVRTEHPSAMASTELGSFNIAKSPLQLHKQGNWSGHRLLLGLRKELIPVPAQKQQ
jgi:hypothetical protein